MKKIEDLFKHLDGMTVEGSTIEQRHEIWELLFENKLIDNQEASLEMESFCLGNNEFYFCEIDNTFIIGFMTCCKNNIPFEDFKNRLLQLND